MCLNHASGFASGFQFNTIAPSEPGSCSRHTHDTIADACVTLQVSTHIKRRDDPSASQLPLDAFVITLESNLKMVVQMARYLSDAQFFPLRACSPPQCSTPSISANCPRRHEFMLTQHECDASERPDMG